MPTSWTFPVLQLVASWTLCALLENISEAYVVTTAMLAERLVMSVYTYPMESMEITVTESSGCDLTLKSKLPAVPNLDLELHATLLQYCLPLSDL